MRAIVLTYVGITWLATFKTLLRRGLTRRLVSASDDSCDVGHADAGWAASMRGPGCVALLWLLTFSHLVLQGEAIAQCNGAPVRIHVDSVLAGENKASVDPRLRPETVHRLRSLFEYRSYRLFKADEAYTPCGQPVAFNLAAGRILHVWPLAIHDKKIALDLLLFAGTRTVRIQRIKVMEGGMLVLVATQNPQDAELTIVTIKTPTASAKSERNRH